MASRTERRGRGPGTLVPNLKRERLLQGYTVRRLAEVAGVDASTVNAVENEHRGVQGSTLMKLAEALGVEPRELVGEALGGKIRVAAGGEPDPGISAMFERWMNEDEVAGEPDEWPEIARRLDEDRPSYRKLFAD